MFSTIIFVYIEKSSRINWYRNSYVYIFCVDDMSMSESQFYLIIDFLLTLAKYMHLVRNYIVQLLIYWYHEITFQPWKLHWMVKYNIAVFSQHECIYLRGNYLLTSMELKSNLERIFYSRYIFSIHKLLIITILYIIYRSIRLNKILNNRI